MFIPHRWNINWHDLPHFSCLDQQPSPEAIEGQRVLVAQSRQLAQVAKSYCENLPVGTRLDKLPRACQLQGKIELRFGRAAPGPSGEVQITVYGLTWPIGLVSSCVLNANQLHVDDALIVVTSSS